MKHTLRQSSARRRDQIAAIADTELTDMLRLAGVEKIHALPAGPAVRGEIEDAVRHWLADRDIGVIVIGADHAALISETIAEFRSRSKLWPVIVELPGLQGEWETDIIGFYQTMARRYLGLEIVLDDGSEDTLAEGDESTAANHSTARTT